jgi:adenine-specific DNA methylase
MLMALLLPDPCDPLCPGEFKASAKESLLHMPGWNTPRMSEQVKSDEGLRKALLAFIGDLADWDNSANNHFLTTARALVKAAHPDETPLVVDPFSGGGSIPLEALRLGCEAFASDLNPVACLILKVMLEDIPRHGPELAEKLRRVGGEIKKQAEKELAEFYPKDQDGSMPTAYLWARTVKCESPNCGAEIPLMRSFWLCKKASRKRALQLKVMRPEIGPPHVEFDIFEPKTDKDVSGGTVTRAKATCPCCKTVLPPERVKAQLTEQNAGADPIFHRIGNRTGGARMMAVVFQKSGESGYNYRLPTTLDYNAVFLAAKALKGQADIKLPNAFSLIPDEERPDSAADRVRPYGAIYFRDLTNIRQRLALSWLVDKCWGIKEPELRRIFTLVIGRCVDYWSSGAVWASGGEFVAHTFGLQVIPIGWDFPEAAPWAESSGSFYGAIDWVARVVEKLLLRMASGQVLLADACDSPLPDLGASIWFTDPPYYDAIRYADLSDSFFVWFKRALPIDDYLCDPFDHNNQLTPKSREAVEDKRKTVNGRPKDRSFFEEVMANAFAEGRRVLKEDGVACVVFAHKTTEGWEALLSGMIRGGWTITGSWPIATERPGRLRSQDSAALATSVHLICRPRPGDATIGDWAEVLRELPIRVGDWMERLQGENIRGADLVFACIGPALEIFSRYRKVETADGSEVKLAEYLEKVWEVVGRTALEQILGTAEARARNGMAGALEEDARLTALFLWTLQSTNGQNGLGVKVGEEADDEAGGDEDEEETAPRGKAKGYSLVFDVVRRFAQPLGIGLPKWEGRVIETKKGVVRLMAVSERAKQLFGDDGADAAADLIEHDIRGNYQQLLFPEFEKEQAPKIRGRGRRKVSLDASAVEGDAMHEATTLDRVHAAMLLQAGGQANALRILIKAEQDRGPDFLRLANALSALYPSGSEEKRLLDAMLLAVPR